MFAWIDIETTGLEERAAGSRLLEVGMAVTTDDLELVGYTSRVIHWPGIEPHTYDDFVREMHEKSGLWELVAIETIAVPITQAERSFVDFMGDHFDDVRPPMAGSSVQFDRRWIAEFMPDLHECFHYRNEDVSGIREFARKWRPDLDDSTVIQQELHRAIPDLLDSIQLARFYKEHLFNTTKETTT